MLRSPWPAPRHPEKQTASGLEATRETTATATAQLLKSTAGCRACRARRPACARAEGAAERTHQASRSRAKVVRDAARRPARPRGGHDRHAADLAVTLAADRVRQTITPSGAADRSDPRVKDIHGCRAARRYARALFDVVSKSGRRRCGPGRVGRPGPPSQPPIHRALTSPGVPSRQAEHVMRKCWRCSQVSRWWPAR
jgi:hypothetical protein